MSCVNCSKSGQATGCARCQTIYCGKECQIQDWQNHRKKCIQIILQSRGLKPNNKAFVNDTANNDVSSVYDSPHSSFHPAPTGSTNITINEEKEKEQLLNTKPKDLPLGKVAECHSVSQCKSTSLTPTHVNNTTTEEHRAGSQKVAITSFIRSNCVYIRMADAETTNRYRLIHRVVDQLSRNLTSLKSVPEEGTFMIVNVNGFKRCTIQEVKGESRIKVFLSDVGLQEIVSIDQLYEPGSRLEKLASTSFIKMFKLENVPEFYLNEKAAEYTKSLLKDDVFLEIEYGSTPDEGRIFDVINNEYINDVLFCYGQDEEPEMVEFEPEDKEFTFINEEIIKIDTIPKKELPQETEVNLMICDNSQLEKNYILYCVNIDDLVEIKEVVRDIHEYGIQNKHRTYKAEKDDVCIAFYAKKKKWCRAKFVEVAEDNLNEAVVCFIDFGKTCNVELKNIIKYPEAFSYFPNYLYCCRVFGLPSPNEELLERLYELLPENVSVKAKSLSVVDTNFHLIEMESILRILSIEDLM